MNTATFSNIERVDTEEVDKPYEITADEFLSLIGAEVFPEDARVYLHEGRILRKMAKTRPHRVIGSMIQEALIHRLPDGWKTISEGEFKLDSKNTTLPDLAVIRGESYRSLLTLDPIEIALAVEIAVTSLAKDPGPNLRRYAKAGVKTYWFADFEGHRVIAHSGPRVIEDQGEYEHVEILLPGGSIPLVLDGQEVARFSFEELMP